MSAYISLYGSVVRDHRSTADFADEHAVASARINAPHPFLNGKALPRDISDDERTAAQARIDGYRSNAFATMEAANQTHWTD